MIHTLRRRLIFICTCSVTTVFVLIFALVCIFNLRQLNDAMDMLTDLLTEGGGAFPQHLPKPPHDRGPVPDFITEETPFSTRFFTVWLTHAGEVVGANTDQISAVTRADAEAFAAEVIARGHERGWIEDYRYKLSENERGRSVVFVDGQMNRTLSRNSILSAGGILLGSLGVIVVLIIVFSGRAIKPILESDAKQKQFITDANHELKTPLTLILTNLDIVEAEVGENEWIADAQAEGQRMHRLIEQMVTLTRMDEGAPSEDATRFSLSDMIADAAAEFEALATARGLGLSADIKPGLALVGDEAGLRRVVAILLDNAVKYCDAGGVISISLTSARHAVIAVENDYAALPALELDRLFDRFYRADPARTYHGGFGIGLSIARSIIERHHGELRAYRAAPGRIGFRVMLRK